jgi:hypothetical protein
MQPGHILTFLLVLTPNITSFKSTTLRLLVHDQICLQSERVWEVARQPGGDSFLLSFQVNYDVRGCIRKFPDWVDNEIYAYNNKHSLRNNIKGYGDKTH